MARVAITEYAAKKLIFGEEYDGVSVTSENLHETAGSLDKNEKYIVKIDVGVKKRGKQGLLRVNVEQKDVIAAAEELFKLGHDRCVIEKMVPHKDEDEKYLSINLVRDGALLIHSDKGGVEIESTDESDIMRTALSRKEVLNDPPKNMLSGVPLYEILEKMNQYHLSFLEINPYVSNGQFTALDMAVEIDSSREGKLPDWAKQHVLHKKVVSAQEEAVLVQDARTQAALNLHTLNPDGSILTLLSGGGASIVGLDSLVTAGLSSSVINYSEYSGAPTREETHVYVNTLLEVLFASKSKKKIILIAGGVANFTDVMVTFQGIVDAFTDNLDKIKKHQIYVCVRRGGPNQENGLAHLRDFLDINKIPSDVHGPSLSLGEVGNLVNSQL